MLSAQGHYNQLPEDLRKSLLEKINSFGEKVRVKFNLSKPNPDPEKRDGVVIWPNRYTLDPRTFDIFHNKQKIKIAIVEGVDEKGIPNKFGKIVVTAGERGIKLFDLTNPEHIDQFAYILLHPKLTNGMFYDKNRIPIITLVDEVKEAKEKREERSARLKALNAAQSMSNAEVVEFADAMTWDSTEDKEVLRARIEDMAEVSPQIFNDLVESKSLKVQALVKQGMDRGHIAFDPAEYKFIWSANQQTITVLQPTVGKNEVEKLAEWLQTSGNAGDAVLKKLKGLLKKEEEPVKP